MYFFLKYPEFLGNTGVHERNVMEKWNHGMLGIKKAKRTDLLFFFLSTHHPVFHYSNVPVEATPLSYSIINRLQKYSL
jgi:hypothetical protein